MRQTLDFLMEGAAEKEIAETIGISRHTVHDYIKAIYRRFDVKTHAQLLVRLARARALQVPRLCTAPDSGMRLLRPPT